MSALDVAANLLKAYLGKTLLGIVFRASWVKVNVTVTKNKKRVDA